MNNLDQLRHTVDLLQDSYDKARADLLRQEEELAARFGFPASACPPELLRTTDGRYILLDALTALVNARTALAQAEAPQPAVREAMVVQPGDVLLLRVDGNLSRDVLDEYSDAIAGPLKERLGLKDVVLLGGIEDWAVQR